MSTVKNSPYATSTNTYIVVCLSSILCIFTSFILLRFLGTPQYPLSKDRIEDPFLSQKRSKHSQYRSFKSYLTSRYADAIVLSPIAIDDFDNRKSLYRQRRDEFRKSTAAMTDLAEWKAQNNDHKYTVLTGLVPEALIGKPFGSKPFAKTDTWFSEFALHNDKSLILSESVDSLIIGNLASYDSRQYPEWFDVKYKPGSITPEGQAFGHTLVVSRKRVFNVIDPEATANGATLLKEMKNHFIRFWEKNDNGKEKLIDRVRLAFDTQNTKLASKPETIDRYNALLPQIEADFRKFAMEFRQLKIEDFVFAFHAYPDNSIGHLHMHVFPKVKSLRKFSSKHHDRKTISLEAVLEVEAEDKDVGLNHRRELPSDEIRS